MNLFNIFTAIITASIICVIIKQHRPEFSSAFAMFVSAAVTVIVISAAGPIISEIYSLGDKISIDGKYIKTILKSIGICYITDFTSSTCKESGQQTLAAKAEFAGKIAMLTVAFPVIQDVLKLSLEILEG